MEVSMEGDLLLFLPSMLCKQLVSLACVTKFLISKEKRVGSWA